MNPRVPEADASASSASAASSTPATTASHGAAPRGPQQTGMRFGHQAGIPTEKSKDFKGTFRRLLVRLRPERTRLIVILVLAFAGVVLNVFAPKILGHATDVIFRGLRSGQGIDFAALHRTLLKAAALYVGGALLAFTQGFMLTGVVQRTMLRLRSDVEDKLHRMPLAYVDGQPRGDLLSRVTNDIDNVAQSMQQSLNQVVINVLTIIGVVIMMVVISPILALVSLITIPLTIVIMKKIGAKSKSRFIAQWKHTGTLNGLVEETFTGHAIVKAFGRDEEARARFAATNQQLHDASFEAQFLSGTIQPVTLFLGNIGYVALAVLGGLRVASGASSIGDIQAIIQYSRQISMPLSHVASMMNVLQSGIASAERIFEVLDAPDETDNGGQHLPADVTGTVEFAGVTFSYTPERPLIEDLSLSAAPGRTVAIVGPTGAGKTTLVNLLMRFYELNGGTISLDGVDIATIPRQELRAQTGMVLQDTWLFDGTIGENIAYGRLDATPQEIRAAAKATYVDRFVHSLPNGYDTRLEEGSTVSAGERQLLTIARAFLADPAILILDEATSSVDTRTEVLIRRAMSALRSNRTSFVIAHRLSTIRDADVILVMEDGRIVESGNHASLLAANGAYTRLYQSQFVAAATDIS